MIDLFDRYCSNLRCPSMKIRRKLRNSTKSRQW